MNANGPGLYISFLGVILLTCFPLYAAEQLVEHLQQQLEREDISPATAAKIELMALERPELLPIQYRKYELPVFSRKTTTLKSIVGRHWQQYSEEEKEILAHFFSRPSAEDLPQSLISHKGRFKIHYTTRGRNATTEAFVEEAADAFEYCYDYEIETLGFRPPPSDFDQDGPEHDVYILNLNDYGSTTYENEVPQTARQDYTGWIQIDNDFNHTSTKGYDALRVTAAHELFHLIQLGYRSFHVTEMSAAFLFEAGATWMEDVVYDDVNDYYYYLPDFFDHPDQQFHVNQGIHVYGLSVFYHMLEQRHGIDAIKTIWEKYIHYEPVQAIDQALKLYGSSFDQELIEFSIWNTHTGAFADSLHYYEEGAYYPELSSQGKVDLYDIAEIEDENADLSVKYFQLVPVTAANFVVSPTFENPVKDYVAVQSADQSPQFQYGLGDLSLNFLARKDSARTWLTVVNASIPQSGMVMNKSSYRIRIERGKGPVQASGITLAAPNPFQPGKDHFLTVEYFIESTTETLTFLVFNESGQVVYSKNYGKRPGGYDMLQWNGCNTAGERVASGVYFLYMIADTRLKPIKVAVVN